MRIVVDLTQDEFTRLIDLARAERRSTRQQAAVLIARGLSAHPDESKALATCANDLAHEYFDWQPTAEEACAPPRWRLTVAQLRGIAQRALAALDYEQIGREIGFDGSLSAAIAETFRAAGCPGTRRTWPGYEAERRWLLSYADAAAAWQWHLAVTNDRTP